MKELSPQLKTVVISHGIEVWQRLPRVRRAALRRADLLIAPSRYTVQKLGEIQGIPTDKIRRLPWSLSPAFLFLAERRTASNCRPNSRTAIDTDRGAFGRVGKIQRRRRSYPRVRAASPHYSRFAPGRCRRWRRPRASAIAGRRNELRDSVHFLPGLSREKLAACYARANVFALPSTGEGFGIVFLEAMALGTPIVAAAAGGSMDLVENEINGLLVPPPIPSSWPMHSAVCLAMMLFVRHSGSVRRQGSQSI